MVQTDFVELADRNRVHEVPTFAVVVAPVNSAIASGQNVVGIRRIDPECVEISVDFSDAIGGKGFSAIFGKIHRRAQGPDAQVVVRIDAHLAVIGRTRVGVAHLFPGFTHVLASENAALLVLHQRIDNVGILAINVQPNAASITAVLIREALHKFFPGDATVHGFVDRAIGAATIETEDRAPASIGCSVERVGTLRVHGDVADAGVVINFQDLRPGFAAIRGFVHATLGIRSPQVAEGSHVNHVGISGIDHDAADVMSGGESHVLPGLAGVHGFVDAIAPGGTLTIVGFTGANPHDGRI